MKKLEMVFPKNFLDELVEMLSKMNLPGYTILEVVSSYSKAHGQSLEFGFSSSQSHLYFFSICDESTLKTIIQKIEKPVKDAGGLIFSSDVDLV